MSAEKFTVNGFFERVEERHQESVERGEHDAECEWGPGFYLCHCAKRRREATGSTEPPTKELYFPPPDCPHCGKELNFDGDSWTCRPCHLAWADNHVDAHFTDDYGDLSRCPTCGRRACTQRLVPSHHSPKETTP